MPFALRMLHAELPSHTGNPAEALNRLYHLLAVIRGVRREASLGNVAVDDSSAHSASKERELVMAWVDFGGAGGRPGVFLFAEPAR